MDARTRTIIEIETIHELLGELDYYRILQVTSDCAQEDVGNGFRTESRRLHPDRMAALRDANIVNKANDVYRLVNEAYRTLKDPEKRAQYDQLLSGGTIRMTDDAARQAQNDKQADDPEHAAKDPRSEKFWKMALGDWEAQNYKACVTNVNFALSFEPENPTFREWKEKAEKAYEEAESLKESNPYKLRLV